MIISLVPSHLHFSERQRPKENIIPQKIFYAILTKASDFLADILATTTGIILGLHLSVNPEI